MQVQSLDQPCELGPGVAFKWVRIAEPRATTVRPRTELDDNEANLLGQRRTGFINQDRNLDLDIVSQSPNMMEIDAKSVGTIHSDDINRSDSVMVLTVAKGRETTLRGRDAG
jgi:hypothetical protein